MTDRTKSRDMQFQLSPLVAECRRETLRRYEEWGLVEPARAGRQRLYSEADIERVSASGV